eukprot:GHVP01053924.1.p1 GENE.GHVP01053924.1~~GHVP01053924.1.p1  ORF type:complete len:1002 (+),score=148.80 GHVP01053924.1:260-3007(+)
METIKVLAPDKINSISIVIGRNLYGYGNPKEPFLKIQTNSPGDIGSVKRLIAGGVQYKEITIPIKTYESNVPSLLRLMIDGGLSAMCWVTISGRKYEHTPYEETTCKHKISVSYEDMIVEDSHYRGGEIAKLKILYFDIECSSPKNTFPDANRDPVIQIGNIIRVNGTNETKKDLFVLGNCSPIPGVDIHSYKTEGEMLTAWRKYLVSSSIDMLIGYNVNNFDIPYLYGRAEVLKIKNFSNNGKNRSNYSVLKKTNIQSRGMGIRDSHELKIKGRIVFDLFQAMTRDYKLRSYSLNSVSLHFLNKQKEDVKHSIITDLHNGTDDDRRRIGTYCMKDVELTQNLVEKLMFLYNYTEIARVTGIPFEFILGRGQQIRVLSKLLRLSKKKFFFMPDMRNESLDGEFEGATVIEPKKGFYNIPITTLDFVSLYPSIIISNNLCYSTYIPELSTVKNLGINKDQISTSPTGDMFISEKERDGLIPEVLRDLLGARSEAKSLLKKEKDPEKKAVLNARQNALKLCANSVYGFTGAEVGFLKCFAVSRSVTAYGRQMINKTVKLVTEKYCHMSANVIYGDTDSVMVDFGVKTVKEAIEIGKEAALYVSGNFKAPIELQFEKVYFPYLLMCKKRYIGLFWTNPDNYDKMDAKGIETVRRDTCPLVSRLVAKSLNLLLIDRNVEGAKEYVKRTVSDILMNRIDMSSLVITKTYSKLDYKVKQPHGELVKKLMDRDPKSCPGLGERVAFVVVHGKKNSPVYERTEDPLYVLQNNIPIDFDYYLENQIRKPIERIFEPILENPGDLLKGEHTRGMSRSAPKNTVMSKFTVKKNKCLNCQSAMNEKGALCYSCKDSWQTVTIQKINEQNTRAEKYSRLWTQCQQCQGSLTQLVICSNNDCPIFYMRSKAAIDVQEIADEINRLNESW